MARDTRSVNSFDLRQGLSKTQSSPWPVEGNLWPTFATKDGESEIPDSQSLWHGSCGAGALELQIS